MESEIQRRIVEALKRNDWDVIKLHGNAFQSGLPDLYAFHERYGTRWIEVKGRKYKFTPAQLSMFRRFAAKKVGVWVMQNDDLSVLFKPANWFFY